MSDTATTKRPNRGRPRKAALATFAVASASLGDNLNVSIEAPNTPEGMAAVASFAATLRSYTSKSVKGATPTPVLLKS